MLIVNIKVYNQQIVFATCSIFRGRPGGRIKWARGPHVGQPCSIKIKSHKSHHTRNTNNDELDI